MRREQRPMSRGGFTLLELLVVIAVIVVLVGLLLPAVNAVREASRRAHCMNNLVQLSLALEQYESVYGQLPPGVSDPNRPVQSVPQGKHHGWLIRVLPYLEQSAIAGRVDYDASVYAAENAAARSVDLAILHCPSSPPRGRGTSNYAGCHHDAEAPIDEDNHGVLFLNSRISHKDLLDGSSFTVFVGEKLVSSGDLGWMSGTNATLRNAAAAARPKRPGAPRGPATATTSPLYVGSFASNHPGGFQLAMGDGSVRFFSGAGSAVLGRLCHRNDGELNDRTGW